MDFLSKTVRTQEQFDNVFHPKKLQFSPSTKNDKNELPNTVGNPILHKNGKPVVHKGKQVKINWKQFIIDAVRDVPNPNPGCPATKQFVRYKDGHYYCTQHRPSPSDILDFMDDIIRAFLSNGFATKNLDEMSFSELQGYENHRAEFRWLLEQRIEFAEEHKDADKGFLDDQDVPKDVQTEIYNKIPIMAFIRKELKDKIASEISDIKDFRKEQTQENVNSSGITRMLYKKDKDEFNANWNELVKGQSSFVHKPKRGKTYKAGAGKHRRTIRR